MQLQSLTAHHQIVPVDVGFALETHVPGIFHQRIGVPLPSGASRLQGERQPTLPPGRLLRGFGERLEGRRFRDSLRRHRNGPERFRDVLRRISGRLCGGSGSVRFFHGGSIALPVTGRGYNRFVLRRFGGGNTGEGGFTGIHRLARRQRHHPGGQKRMGEQHRLRVQRFLLQGKSRHGGSRPPQQHPARRKQQGQDGRYAPSAHSPPVHLAGNGRPAPGRRSGLFRVALFAKSACPVFLSFHGDTVLSV